MPKLNKRPLAKPNLPESKKQKTHDIEAPPTTSPQDPQPLANLVPAPLEVPAVTRVDGGSSSESEEVIEEYSSEDGVFVAPPSDSDDDVESEASQDYEVSEESEREFQPSDSEEEFCKRCGRDSHDVADCYAQTTVDGSPIYDDF